MPNTVFVPAKEQTEKAELLFELWKTLGGNARAFDPLPAGMYPELIVLECVKTTSKKGHPMIRVKLRDAKSGRECTTYVMEWLPEYDVWKAMERGDVVAGLVTIDNGFAKVEHRGRVKHLLEVPPLPNDTQGHVSIIVYDIEVFAFDFVICAEDLFTGQKWEIVNNLEEARQWYLQTRDSMYTGYNSYSYDNNVTRGYLQGKDAYQLSQAVIKSDDRGLIYKLFDTRKTPILGCDIYHAHKGFSLKEHEGFMGLEIKETDVDFDNPEKLTPEELRLEIDYCWKDVDATKLQFYKMIDPILAKAFICAMFGLDKRSFNQTEANLVAEIMGAERPSEVRDDLTSEWQIPDNLNVTIPEVLEMFTGHEFELNKKGKPVAKGTYVDPETGYTIKYGAGGVHGAVSQYIHIGRFLQDDAASLYPWIYILFAVLSRNVPEENKHLIRELLDKRIEAKYSTEEFTHINGVQVPMAVLVDGVKRPVNSLFGATGAEFNGLYDPRYQFLTCVIGQCVFTDFYEGIRDHVQMIQTNTDAHTFIPNSEEDERIVDEYVADLSKRTGLKFDKDEFIAIYQKDVNNYVAIDAKGKVKMKGAVSMTNGLKFSKAIVSNAFLNYVVSGVDFNEYIDQCDDLRQFQMITKTGWQFDKTVFVDADGNEHPAQKVNRVFATKVTERAVRLYKVKTGEIVQEEDEETEEVSFVKGEDRYVLGLNNAPECYEISNERIGEGITLDQVDREYYKREVEGMLVLWFGENWRERLDEAHAQYVDLFGELPEARLWYE